MSAPIALVLALQAAPTPAAPERPASTVATAPASSLAPTAPAAAPAASPLVPAAAPALRDELSHRRLVVAHTYALEFGVRYPVPSGGLALFLGTDLPPRRARGGRVHRAALGYQLTLSLGRADLVYAESPRNLGLTGLLTHRHAVALLGRSGARGRLYHALAVAAVFGGSAPVGLDVELRLGHIFGAPGRRVQGVVGGQLRVGAPFAGPLLPQLGAFVGLLAF